MSDTPLISVILPSYNHAEFVAIAVESVLDQTFRNLELIVVDDGSSDGTPDIVERIHDPRLRLIRLQQNRLRHPRNLALDLAQGRYIAFQNSDDIWHPEKLEIQMKFLEKTNDVLACFTDVEIIDREGNIAANSWANGLFSRKNRSQLQWLNYFFETGNCLCITSALVQRDAIEHAGRFRGSFIQLSDFELWVRLAAIGEFHIAQEKLTLFRDTTTNKTSTTGAKNLSRPNIDVKNRSVLEYATLLENYATAPIIDMLPKIFPEAIPAEPTVRVVRLAHLAKYAWSKNTVFHSLFADNVMSHIMDEENSRQEVTDVLGAEIIQEFVKRRGNLLVHFADQHPVHLYDKDQIINVILDSQLWKIKHFRRVFVILFQKFKVYIEKFFRH